MNDLRITEYHKFEEMIKNEEFTGLPEESDFLVKVNNCNMINVFIHIKKILQEKKISCKLSVGENYLLVEQGSIGEAILELAKAEIVDFYF